MSAQSAQRIWNGFCERFSIVKECVPLFEFTAHGTVATKSLGKAASARSVLARSAEMEAMILREAEKLLEDWESKQHKLDGLIYCMGWKQHGHFIPLYIGKAETFGKGDGNLSANLQNIHSDRSKFARWGHNYAYHIGDLSACVLPGHSPDKATKKYTQWAQTLFVEANCSQPVLKQPVYFWCKAWNPAHVGIWEELGPTSLAFLEYLLIGVAGRMSPELLNREGNESIGRRGSGTA
jgi:hypothetical protein